jgi:hypothetical protein
MIRVGGNYMEDEKAKGHKISVDIHGDTFEFALALRHKQEASEKRVIGISEIIRGAVKEKFDREIGKVSVES